MSTLALPNRLYFPLYHGDQDNDNEFANQIVSTARSNIKLAFFCPL